ncbi:MAG: hypothetical protein KIS91_02985 [Anaerolineae bacterium]|nr:hypothetical protein [Anaerolineae bacterium]
MMLLPPHRPALDAGLTFIEERRWADAVAALERARAETPCLAATYWLAQARFQQASHAPVDAPLERLAHWQQVAADLADARQAAGTRVEVDLALLALEARVVRAEILAAICALGEAANARRPGARADLAALAGQAALAPDALPEGRWPGRWLVTVALRRARHPHWVRCVHLGAGVWLVEAAVVVRRRRRRVGYLAVVAVAEAEG